MNKPNFNPGSLSRRDFLKASAVVTAGLTTGLMANGNYAYARSADTIRIGLIGCGGRGTGAAVNAVEAAPGVELVAMGDLFPDHLARCKETVAKEIKTAFKVTDATSFTGWDAYQKVIASDVDLVILATPPGFRPIHLKAAIEAGKHVFMEKPVAVDPPGVRSVIASAELAKQKKLGIVAGTQRRHSLKYNETIKRIHDGAIGEILGGQVYWNQGSLWSHKREAAWSDVEFQLRNWLYYGWLSGDHIVEQHVHNIDVANWVLNAHPIKATALGGRQARLDPIYGHIYDHFAVDFEYPNGVKILSMCRQQEGCTNHVGEFIQGTKGTSDPSQSIKSAASWTFEGKEKNPYVQEHTDLIESIRAGNPLNEGRQVAESVLAAIMGREAAYTGQELTWDQVLNSNLTLFPDHVEFGPMKVDQIAIPGVTKLERPNWW